MLRLGLYTGASRTAMARASLILDFLMPTLDKRIDFTRTTAATYVDSDGYIKSTPASKNLLTYTQEFDNAAWVKTGVAAYPFDPALATYGPERVTNGDFSGGSTGWTLGTGWAVAAGIATKTAGVASALTSSASLSVGRVYAVTYTISGMTAGNAFAILTGGAQVNGAARTVNGTYTDYIVAVSGNNAAGVMANASFDGSIDNISVREVIGGLIAAPDGTLTADKLEETTTGGTGHWAFQSTTTIAAAHTFSVYMKGAGRTWGLLRIRDSSGNDRCAWFNLATGVVGTVQANLTASISSAGGGWYRCSITVSAALAGSNPCVVGAANADNSLSYTGDGTSGVYLWGAQLEAVPDANLVLGSELVSNGDFASGSTGWTLGSGVTVSGGAAQFASVSSGVGISQTVSPVFSTSSVYRVSVTISGYTAGTLSVRCGSGGAFNALPAANGTHTITVFGGAANGTLQFFASIASTSFTIDNITVKEITGTTDMLTTYTRNFGGSYPPRFDYDPVTKAPRGLLVEEQRMNLLLRSEEFENASWVKTSSTVTANAAVSPDGTMDADKVIVNNAVTLGTSSGAGVRQVNSKSASAITYTYTVYMKAGEFNSGFLFMSNAAISASARASFDLSAGIASATVTVGAFTNASARMTPVGNGWYRCSLTATSDTGPDLRCDVFPTDTVATQGNGTSGIYIWGAQLEAGAFPTSYIPTQASQVTRTADIATIMGANFSNWYNQSEGTFVAEFDCSGSSSALSADDATNNNFIRVGRLNTTGRLRVFSGGAEQADAPPANGAGWSGSVKVAGAFKANDFAASASGGTVATDAAGSVPAITQLRIGTSGGGDPINGHIRSIRYYPTRLSNAQLQSLSA